MTSREKTEGTKVISVLALVGVGAEINSLSHLVNWIIGQLGLRTTVVSQYGYSHFEMG